MTLRDKSLRFIIDLATNRPAEAPYFITALDAISWVTFSRAKSGLQESILLLREGDNHLPVFFLFVHSLEF
nr:MAG TPA: hypothetical protein [Caudoviricetes sp.]